MATAHLQSESKAITQLHELTLPPSRDDVPRNFQDNFNNLMSELESAVMQLSKSDVAATKDVYTLFSTCGGWFFKDHYKIYRRLIIDKLCACGFVENVIRFFEQLDKSELFKRTTFLGLSVYDHRSKIFFNVLSTLCNFTDSSVMIGSDLAKKGIIPLLLAFLKHDDLLQENLTENKWPFVNSVLGTIGNMARLCPDTRPLWRENNAIQILLEYSVTRYMVSRADCYLTISFLITDEEVDLLKDTGSTIEFLMQLLSTALQGSDDELIVHGYSPTEILLGLNNLALNDSNKVIIVKCGGLQLLSKTTEVKDNIAMDIIAAELTWKLAFMEENRQKIKDEKNLIKALIYWYTSHNSMLKRASSGALWETFEGKLDVIRLQRGTSVSGLVEKQLTHGPHVMLSYQWDVQPTIIKLKEKLKQAGYNVWMDVDKMEGDILEAMAAAVENAAVVLVAVSKKYKDSNSCRTEATYAYKHSKPIIPLIVESNYEADGWLGALIGTLKYFQLECDSSVDNEFRNIQKEIGNRGISQEIVIPVSETPLSSKMNMPSDVVDSPQTGVFSWTTDDVKAWLTEIKMGDYNSCMEEVNGEMLVQLIKLSKKAPDFFYSQLKMDYGMNLNQILKFTNALDKLQV